MIDNYIEVSATVPKGSSNIPTILMKNNTEATATERGIEFLKMRGEVIIVADTHKQMYLMLRTASNIESHFRGERRDVLYMITKFPNRNGIRYEAHGYLQEAMVYELRD